MTLNKINVLLSKYSHLIILSIILFFTINTYPYGLMYLLYSLGDPGFLIFNGMFKYFKEYLEFYNTISTTILGIIFLLKYIEQSIDKKTKK